MDDRTEDIVDRPAWPTLFFINLDRSRDRRDAFEAASARAGIATRRVAATDGRAVARDRRQDVDAARFRRTNGRPMLDGEYGCYRSHVAALEALVESGLAHAVIAEDDIVPDAAGMDRVAAIVEAAPDFAVVKLVNHRTPFFVEQVRTHAGDRLGRTVHGPQGSAAAYLVSRQAAIGLLAAIRIMDRPYDVELERFWHHGVDVTSVKEDVFAFAPSRDQSTIASTAGPQDRRDAPHRRLRAYGCAALNVAQRFHAVFAPRPAAAAGTRPEPSRAAQALMALAVMATVMAVWLESDLYRYAAPLAVFSALAVYFRETLWTEQRALIGWAGFACLVWAIHVAIRITAAAADGVAGSAEGVYLLVGLYPTFGFALWLWVRRPLAFVIAFSGISVAVLALTTHYAALLDRSIVPTTLLHQNTIHAALAAGFIAITSACLLLHAVRGGVARRRAAGALASVALVLALANVYLLNSKGVWLALGATLPVLLVSALVASGPARVRMAALAMTALIALAALAGGERLRAVAGDTARSSLALAASVVAGEGAVATMDRLIEDPATPESSRQRLMLWSSAVRIWQDAPVFGHGPRWRELWAGRHHQAMDTTLIHNGYVEIAIRYGFVGLAFYAALAAWACATVWKAWRAGLIARAALECFLACAAYFALSLMTNSNNRLAIGESFMLIAFGFAFWCQYALQHAGAVRRRTWF